METRLTEKPNFLQIEVELKLTKQPIFIIGTRIRDTDDHTKQFQALKEHLDNLPKDSKLICAGDFNEWKNHVSNNLGKSYNVCTPRYDMAVWQNYDTLDKWSAVVRNQKTKKDSKTLIDHIITKNVRVTNEDYLWDFVNKENEYGDLNPEDNKTHLIGLPDHAILIADIEI
jgi:endonuclease/exonuclease/phosphatase family metal-dependent hydrolase